MSDRPVKYPNPVTKRVIRPTADHTHTVIFLHGRSTDKVTEFASTFLGVQTSDKATLPILFPSIKWIFPQAPSRYSKQLKQNFRQWFDMWSTLDPQKRSEEQIPELNCSIGQILPIIESEANILGSHKKVFLGGVHMGCAIGWLLLFQIAHRLGGFIGISGWLPLSAEFEDIGNMEPKKRLRELTRFMKAFHHQDPAMKFKGLKTPCLLRHSPSDDAVPIRHVESMEKVLDSLQARPKLPRLSLDSEFYTHAENWYNEPSTIEDIAKFISRKTGIRLINHEKWTGENKYPSSPQLKSRDETLNRNQQQEIKNKE